MKKSLVALLLMISIKVFANPIALPPIISEFYYNGGDWQIEVYFSDIYQNFFYDFSELALICNNDTAHFVDGLLISFNETIVLNQNALTSAFNINPVVDWIYLASVYGYDPFTEGIRYDAPGIFLWHSILTSPKEGESIVNQFFNNYGGDGYYQAMKESTPSIGSNAFECSGRGTFSGYVYDQYNNPVANLQLVYCPEYYCLGAVSPAYSCIETDENGFFETNELFCNWHIFNLKKDDFIFYTDTLFIEPDSAYYKEYILNSVDIPLNTSKEDISISIAPNPLKNKTRFELSFPENHTYQNARITIRDNNGRIVDFIPITNAPWGGNKLSLTWYPGNAPRPIPPGMYLYCLEIDGKTLSTEKMIITK